MVKTAAVLTQGGRESSCEKICAVFPAPPNSWLPIGLAISLPKREQWWTLETKYLLLRTPVELARGKQKTPPANYRGR